ncbi:MAG: ABC transporter permease [Proteobacteria bacterium]|nr:ABC transporter permease [Pseudomonadota bacterium]MCP4919828.1 ABC transporter permease [Pseudomonadota bacterium]
MTGFIAGLALKNLLRNRRRNAITSVAVVWGVALMILGFGFVDGLDENMVRSQIDTMSGHVIVRPPAYPEVGLSAPVDVLEAVPDELSSALGGHTHTERLRFDVRLVAGADAVRAIGIGLAETDEDVFPRDGFHIDGDWSGVVLGARLARLLDVQVGTPVALQVRTTGGALNALRFPVSGVLSSGNPAIDNYAVLLPMDTAIDLVQAPGPSEIALRLPLRSQSDAVAASLPGGWQVQTYLQEAEGLLEINEVRRKALAFMVLMIMAIAATGIANTVIMATYERTREIGTLAAMGMTPAQIRVLFLVEGASMGLVAGIVGAVFGGAVNGWFATHGIDLTSIAESGTAVAFDTTLYTAFSWGPLVGGVAFGTGVAALASLYPANWAARLDPAAAVRAD